ncbi:MAG: hypothetical protein GVY05_08930 [Bacteroidetes bacterium]|jgi:chromosome segregation ATPase|nr:hypothetical protein [Bacteroidota bacterium]
MKLKLILITLLFVFLTTSCDNRTNQSKNDSPRANNVELLSKTKAYKDSLENASEDLKNLGDRKATIEQSISKLSNKRDSVSEKLRRVKQSIKNIKDRKLSTNVEKVNAKLNELKGVKEGLVSQTNLKKKEIDLANSKVNILHDEKQVYTSQKQALFDEGAAPEAFARVDSLLQAINYDINSQKALVRNLERKVTDNEVEIERLNKQRAVLSEKIRKNYDAENILNEYNNEEAKRLENLLQTYNNQIDTLALEASSLSTDYNIARNETSNLQQKVDTSLKKYNQEAVQTNTTENKNDNGKLSYAMWIILAVFVILVILYYVGKKNKSKRLKK